MENYFNACNYFSISHWAIKKGKVFIRSLSSKELQLINKLDYSLKLVPAHLMTAFSSVYKLNSVKSLTGMPCWQLVSSDMLLWSLAGRFVVVKCWALSMVPQQSQLCVRAVEEVHFLVCWDSWRWECSFACGGTEMNLCWQLPLHFLISLTILFYFCSSLQL